MIGMAFVLHRRRRLFKPRPHARGANVPTCSYRHIVANSNACQQKQPSRSRCCIQLGAISNDPIGFNAGDANLSRYVNNQPTTYTDPFGLEWWETGQKGERDWNSVGGWNPWGWNFPIGQQQLLFYAAGGWSAADRSNELARERRELEREKAYRSDWDGNVQGFLNTYKPTQCEVDGIRQGATFAVEANASLLGGGLVGKMPTSASSRILAQLDHLDEVARTFNRGNRVFKLEQGSAQSGWKHIWDRHVDPTRFLKKSKFDSSYTTEDALYLLEQTLKHGKESSYEGSAVFEFRIRRGGCTSTYRATVNADGTIQTFHPLD
jgi:hypothetical protein